MNGSTSVRLQIVRCLRPTFPPSGRTLSWRTGADASELMWLHRTRTCDWKRKLRSGMFGLIVNDQGRHARVSIPPGTMSVAACFLLWMIARLGFPQRVYRMPQFRRQMSEQDIANAISLFAAVASVGKSPDSQGDRSDQRSGHSPEMRLRPPPSREQSTEQTRRKAHISVQRDNNQTNAGRVIWLLR